MSHLHPHSPLHPPWLTPRPVGWLFALAVCCACSVARAQRAPSPADGATPDDVTLDEAPAERAPAPAEPGDSARRTTADLREALAAYAHEPSIERVVQAALASAPAPAAADLASRARTAGWVPTLSLRARRGQGVDLSHVLADDTLKLATDDDLTLEAALSFALDRVVFRSEEVALARQARDEARARQARVREVIALYFERRRLQLERDLAGDPGFARSMRIAEIEALLDVFTNGAFQRMIGRPRWTTTGAGTAASRSRSPRSSKSTARR